MTAAGSQMLEAVLLPDGLLLEWQPALGPVPDASLALQHELYRRFHEEADGTPAPWLFRLGFAPDSLEFSTSLEFWRNFAAAFAQALALTEDLEELRHRAVVPPPESGCSSFLENAPLGNGFEHLSPERLTELWEALNRYFQVQVRAHKGSVAALIHALRPELELAGKVFLHLVENRKGSSAPFAFLATYSTRVDGTGSARHVPLKHAIQEFGGDQQRLLELLTTVYHAATQSELLRELLESGRIFHPLAMSGERALTFLREVPLYESAGIRCRIPNWWTAKTAKARVGLSLNIGGSKPSELGMKALISCQPQLEVGGEPVSLEEARQLLGEADGLVLIKNKWVEVNHENLTRTLDAYEKARELVADGMTLSEAMRQLLTRKSRPELQELECTVSFGDWLDEVVRKMTDPALVREATPASGFQAVLRPYQQLGLNWLTFLDSVGFGACLADDMGLGKTIQVLAFLSILRQCGRGSSLLVLPASLLGNWQDEIARFLPELRVLVAHSSGMGASAARQGLDEAELAEFDLVITTYGMTQRAAWLKQAHWDYVILDEAQAIKNPAARQTRAVKELHSRNRLVLTGTPVENRLGDLWSIFDFLNPGLLGGAKEFSGTVKELQAAPDGYARLRRVISPYILRRLKTDRSIISDLPDKVEMKTYSELSKRQVVLYRNLVQELTRALEEAEGMQRRGLVLASLLKFKQICNHPDQYLGGTEFTEADAVKFARLREICETVAGVHEHILVFTQFREMTAPLDRFLAQVFGHQGLVLDGSVPVAKRRELVERFQNSRDYLPYMVLSVKAGGVGLNLTRANHVVHFDRWWNPAVENQATDRAFRIGQEKNVLVHKFITRGTVEEKIDKMISDKLELAQSIVTDNSEAWITEMDNRQLLDLFTLTI